MMFLLGNKKIDDAYWLQVHEQIKELINLGQTLQASREAEALYEYSKKNGGREDDRTINALNNLGYVHMLRNDYEKAEYCLLDALQESEQIFGKYSKEVAILCMNLGKMYLARSQYVASQIETQEDAAQGTPASL